MDTQKNRKLSRAQRLDPEDRFAALARLTARARIEGPEILLQPLRHLYSWVRTDSDFQDLAIHTIAGLLGMGWSRLKTTKWCCSIAMQGFEDQVHVKRSYRIATFIHKATGIEFQLLPGGRPSGRRVLLQPFLIARWPVTEEQFDGIAFSLRRSSRPKTNLSGVECDQWLRSHNMELPTPGQWEYACRAGTTTNYYWGNSPNPDHMWTRENAERAVDCSNNDFKKNWNAFGLVDTIGNVWEVVGAENEDGFRRRLGLSYRSERHMAPFHPSLTRVLKTADTGFRPVINLPVKITQTIR